jgi:hypothetical protein
LNVKLEFSSAGSNVPGTVVRQTPPAGAPLTGLEKVDLYVATVLRPEEHAAGLKYLSLTEVMMLDDDEPGVRQAWDVGLQRASGSANLMLQFGNGATGVRVSPTASDPSKFDAAQCRSVTATWSDKSILIPQRLDSMDVCVRTTKGRLALLRLEELTPEPELKLRYSTLR